MSKTFGGENEKMIKVKFIKPCLIFIESIDNYQKGKKNCRRHLLIYSVSLLKTSSPVRTNSFHISDNPFKSNKLQRSTDDHLLSVPKSGQRQNPDCNVIFFRVEEAQLLFTLQSVSHFGISFVRRFHFRRKI